MFEARIQELAARRREAASRLGLFDANLWLGRPQGFPLADEFDVAALRGAMAEHFIAGGLVSHWRGKTVSPQEGNAALQAMGQELAAAGLHVIMTGLPLVRPEVGPLPGQGEPHPRTRGVRVFPKTHGFPLTPWCAGTLCEWLVARRLPLFVWHTELDWGELRDLARQLPDLSIVVESQPRKIIYQARPLFALMNDCPNVFLEISNLTGPCFDLALGSFGPERLIFGSFMPVGDPFVPSGLILDAAMSDADRALVAGGNLRRLIDEGTP